MPVKRKLVTNTPEKIVSSRLHLIKLNAFVMFYVLLANPANFLLPPRTPKPRKSVQPTRVLSLRTNLT